METEVLKIDPETFSPEILEKPAKILREGGVIGFPTETVYGLGANRNLEEALQNLSRLKERPLGKHYTLHIPDKEMIYSYISQVPPLAQRLIEVYWPGPLTVILPSGEGETLGFRLPANKIARELLRQAGVPIVASSANPADLPPSSSASEVVAYYQGKIPLVIDGGGTPLREASTVVQFDSKSWKMLREGIITEKMVEKLTDVKVLFICTGNTCRSPLAEGLLKKMISQRLGLSLEELENHGYEISSAGINTPDGSPASSYSQEAAKDYSLDLSGHRARQVTREMLERVNLVYVMTGGHYRVLEEHFPDLAHKIYLLNKKGVKDPYGGSLEEYRRCAVQLQESLNPLLKALFPSSLSEKKSV